MRKKSPPREFKERHHFKRQESSDSDHYLVMLVFGGVVLSRLVEELQVGVFLGALLQIFLLVWEELYSIS